MYYLQSRYYDPQVGRFINADGYASTGQGILGNNMFAYCNNCPTIHADPSGVAAKPTTVSVSDCKLFTSAMAYELQLKLRKEKRKAEIANAISELINLQSTDDPNIVLQAEYFGMYKDTLVIKTEIMDQNVGFSLGVILVGKNSNSTDLIKHEYGHRVHLSQIGLSDYIFYVVLPSVICYNAEVEYADYYSLPWEFVADVLGDVSRDNGQYVYADLSPEAALLYYLLTLTQQ